MRLSLAGWSMWMKAVERMVPMPKKVPSLRVGKQARREAGESESGSWGLPKGGQDAQAACGGHWASKKDRVGVRVREGRFRGWRQGSQRRPSCGGTGRQARARTRRVLPACRVPSAAVWVRAAGVQHPGSSNPARRSRPPSSLPTVLSPADSEHSQVLTRADAAQHPLDSGGDGAAVPADVEGHGNE